MTLFQPSKLKTEGGDRFLVGKLQFLIGRIEDKTGLAC